MASDCARDALLAISGTDFFNAASDNRLYLPQLVLRKQLKMIEYHQAEAMS